MKNLSFVSSTRLSIILAFSFFILSLFISIQSAYANIQPYRADKFYWQYNGAPVLLLGGSNNDNLFQTATESYMNEMKNAGVNYLRNVMSDRDTGDLRAFHRRSDGKYDLNQWDNAYWTKFENFLRMARDREMIVQIEVWDRFDHAESSIAEPELGNIWGRSPWNPANNINYTTTQSGLATYYGLSYRFTNQPFFYTVPALRNNTTVLQYQNKFVDKMLSISLKYPTVIYSIDNETSSLPEWGRYWAQRIKTAAATAKGKTVYITEMYEEGFDITAPQWKYVFDYPNMYSFSEISMHNYHIGDEHWNGIQWARHYLASRNRPWPLNNVKNSGNANNVINSTGRNTTRHALERFWRHVIGGSAGTRFHRDNGGLGLNSEARAAIAAARKLETMVKMWEVNPSNHLLSSRASNEAYLAAKPGEKYALYFTNGGSVGLNLSGHPGSYILRWINPQTGNWGTERTVSGGGTVNITAPSSGYWVAAIVREGLTSSTPTPTPTTTTHDTSPEPTTVSPTSPVTTSVTGSKNVSTVAALRDGTIYLSSEGSIVAGADGSNLAFLSVLRMYSILQLLPPKAQKQVLVIRWK